jgi:glycosyltransferase involved in cell wall biosynthesis
MIQGKRIVVVMPAYNASRTLELTYSEIPFNIVDEVILVDDESKDETVAVAQRLGIKKIIRHEENKGYGGNQKTCYKEALRSGADVIVMLHPDYQYTPLLIEALAFPVAKGVFQAMLGSRILGKGALKGGMPFYKYVSNRILTFIQNIFLNHKLAEYHTGYRAFERTVLEKLPLEENSDDFIFDNEMLAQILFQGYSIGEVTCPTKYFKEASTINFVRSIRYGLGVLRVSICYRLQKWGIGRYKIFDFESGQKLKL